MENRQGKPIVLIIGGGFAGLTALHHLRHTLGKQVAITLVDANRDSVNRPTMPEVAFTGRPAAHALFPLDRAVGSDAAVFHHGTIISIDVSLNQVHLRDGHTLVYDYLIIAAGAIHDYDAVTGLDEYGYSVCDESHAVRCWAALQDFTGGAVVIGSAPTRQGTRVKAPVLKVACEGPVGEAMFMMDDYLCQHLLRD